MSYVGEAYFTASVPSSTSLGIGVRPVPEPLPGTYLNVRLTNGNQFYSAGFSGSTSFTTVDQGNAGLLSQAWPVKPTDGTGIFGTLGYPSHVLLASGGQAVGVAASPLHVTGNVGIIAQANTNVTTLSGSVVGLLYGGMPASSQNPLWVTGSVRVVDHPTTTTAISGSVVGLLVGGQPVSSANRLPVTGSVSLSEAARVNQGTAGVDPWLITGSIRSDQGTSPWTVTGSVSLTQGVSVSNVVSTTGSISISEPVVVRSGSLVGLLVGGQPLAQQNPLPITGTVSIASGISVSNVVSTTGSVSLSEPVVVRSGSVIGLLVGGQPLARANQAPVADRYLGGESLADQPGAGTALTFSFASSVDLIWVRCDGGDGRADPFGGTPSATAGIYCEDGIPQPITLTTSSLKVFANVGTTARVWGFKY